MGCVALTNQLGGRGMTYFSVRPNEKQWFKVMWQARPSQHLETKTADMADVALTYQLGGRGMIGFNACQNHK